MFLDQILESSAKVCGSIIVNVNSSLKSYGSSTQDVRAKSDRVHRKCFLDFSNTAIESSVILLMARTDCRRGQESTQVICLRNCIRGFMWEWQEVVLTWPVLSRDWHVMIMNVVFMVSVVEIKTALKMNCNTTLEVARTFQRDREKAQRNFGKTHEKCHERCWICKRNAVMYDLRYLERRLKLDNVEKVHSTFSTADLYFVIWYVGKSHCEIMNVWHNEHLTQFLEPFVLLKTDWSPNGSTWKKCFVKIHLEHFTQTWVVSSGSVNWALLSVSDIWDKVQTDHTWLANAGQAPADIWWQGVKRNI